MKSIFLLLSLTILSCTTPINWRAKNSSQQASFSQGHIELTPLHTYPEYSLSEEVIVVHAKVKNTTGKNLHVDPRHIVLKTNSGKIVEPLSESEMRHLARGAEAWSNRQRQMYIEFTGAFLGSKNLLVGRRFYRAIGNIGDIHVLDGFQMQSSGNGLWENCCYR